ncbi:MAG: ATP-binding protein [Mycobacteriales bacterium]
MSALPLSVALALVLPPAGAAGAFAGDRWARRKRVAVREELLVRAASHAVRIAADAAAGDSVIRELGLALGADAGGLAAIDGEELRLLGLWNYWPVLRHRVISRGEGLSGQVWLSGRGRIVADLAEEPAYIPSAEGLRSAVYAPGFAGGEVRVVIGLESRRLDAFRDRDLRAVTPVADLLARLLVGRRQLRDTLRGGERLLAELNLPLRAAATSLVGSLDTLARQHARLAEPDRRHLSDGAARAQARLTRLADGLSLAANLSRGTAGSGLQDVDLADLVGDIGHGHRARVDPLAIRRAVEELVRNADQHGGGGHVSVAANGASVLVTVRDHGPGLPGPVLDALRAGRPIPGGLGLHLVRALVMASGGALAAWSRPGRGARMTLQLPDAG